MRLPLAVLGLGGMLVSLASAQQWTTTFPEGEGLARAIALMADGDVVSVGFQRGLASRAVGLVTRVAGVDGAPQWVAGLEGTHVNGFSELMAVAVDPSQELLVAGRVRNAAPAEWDVVVAKLAGANGATIWRTEIDGSLADPPDTLEIVRAVGVDATGDVFVTGTVLDTTRGVFSTIKLSGATGAIVWRHDVDPASGGQGNDLVVDAAGDVVVIGTVSPPSDSSHLIVRKLDGATGTPVWTHDRLGVGNAVTLDPLGNPVIAGQGHTLVAPGDVDVTFLVSKLDGVAGSVLWSFASDGGRPDGTHAAHDVVVAPTGDVAAVGDMTKPDDQRAFQVVSITGATGAERWRRGIAGDACCTNLGLSVVADAIGMVTAAGLVANSAPRLQDLAVVQFDAATGDERWARVINGGDDGNDAGVMVRLDAAGQAIVGGALAPATSPPLAHHAVLAFDAATGGDYLLEATRLRVKDRAPATRLLTLKARTVLPRPFSLTSDSDPTIGGGTLTLVNPTTNEEAVLTLPAAGWSRLGGGYRYRDPAGLWGPCGTVIATSTEVKAKCRGAGITFTLDEAAQGRLAVTLATGTAQRRRCHEFGGVVTVDVPGLFAAKAAPAPSTCP